MLNLTLFIQAPNVLSRTAEAFHCFFAEQLPEYWYTRSHPLNYALRFPLSYTTLQNNREGEAGNVGKWKKAALVFTFLNVLENREKSKSEEKFVAMGLEQIVSHDIPVFCAKKSLEMKELGKLTTTLRRFDLSGFIKKQHPMEDKERSTTTQCSNSRKKMTKTGIEV